MAVQVGHLYRKTILRDLAGNIRDMRDEADGGWIIRNYQVVNQEKIDEMARKEEDRKLSAVAQQHAIEKPELVAVRQGIAPKELPPEAPVKSDLEKRVDGMESKLDAILTALKK